MPAEWEKHERTWMAWPSAGYTLSDDQVSAYETWSSVANAIVKYEPVSILVSEQDVLVAREYLHPSIEIITCELNDAWMRDIAPTFVKNVQGNLAAVNWIFNGWGAAKWACWDKDEKVASFVAQQIQVQVIDSPLINEGGGIHVNGQGLVLLTESVQLGEGRNRSWSRERVEEEIHARLGTSKAIWLKRGLTRDNEEFGTRGHVDMVACFVDEKRVLFHMQSNPDHPDHSISIETRDLLTAAGLEAIPVLAPLIIQDDKGFVDYSYINHYVVNGAVILCAFGDPNDQKAAEQLKEFYPNRDIVLVPATPLFDRGGGIHCITQQQPATN